MIIPTTEEGTWKLIEHLGFLVWNINHDLGKGCIREDLIDKLKSERDTANQDIVTLVKSLKRFDLELLTETDEIANGYWIWYYKWKNHFIKQQQETINFRNKK